ncbi:PREDICTED: chromogranin-A isoform X2 [Chinchilla lanigera]|uniref:Chromogranin-A n=1 Tax=Chinchilla lanigera TaxID=34839 RepID=A0A8C2VKE3_CHILA|nr:PREDICTED: chromogranin-A isoform X2 [Chinchilla lanigera]
MARGQTDRAADAGPPRRCAPARPSSLSPGAAVRVPKLPAAPRSGFAMHSSAVLAFLLCAGQVTALPVNSPMTKGDTEVMKCIVEVISDSLSKPSPMPVSQECLEILRGDERILSILRHQNLLRELQDLALQGTKERAQQQKKDSSFEEELSEVVGNRGNKAKQEEVTEEASPKEAMEQGGDAKEEKSGEAKEEAGPQALPEPGRGSVISGSKQTPSKEEEEEEEEEEEAAPNTQPPASLPSEKHPDLQPAGDTEGPAQVLEASEEGQGAQQERPAKREEEEEDEEEAGKKAVPGEEDPTAALNSHQDLSDKEIQKGDSRLEALAVDGAGKTGTEQAQPPEGRGEQEQEQEEEEMAGAPRGPFPGGKSGELEQEEERLSREWEDAKRWSKMDQLAKELAAEKRLEGEDEEDDPDHSMKLSFRAPAYGFRGPGPQLRRGWRPSSREDSIEASLPLQSRGFPEEKKEEEGSANRRAEVAWVHHPPGLRPTVAERARSQLARGVDQELESLSAIEAELEKVAHQLQALRRG